MTRAFNAFEARRLSLRHDGCTSITAASYFNHRHGGTNAGYCTVAGGAVGSGSGVDFQGRRPRGEQNGPKGGPVGGRSVDANETGTGSEKDGGCAALGGGGEGSPLGRIQPRLMMVFTCSKCETRSTKSFSKQSYTRGVVLVRCPGCHRLHLIADHLRWFGEEPFMLHEFLDRQGENVIRVTVDDHTEATEPHPVECGSVASVALSVGGSVGDTDVGAGIWSKGRGGRTVEGGSGGGSARNARPGGTHDRRSGGHRCI
ncbi:hypothetical protein Vafri_1836 [Volvox africanus]|nr:hypothetical protein Vafri_1836 [Volvox africanus]